MISTPATPTLFSSPATTDRIKASVRTITWSTNYNNKMGCDGMVHIDLAPFKKPIRSELENTIIEIYTSDQSHPPIKAVLFDMLFLKLNKVSCMMTMASHGLDEIEFVNFMFDKYPEKMDMNTELAVYFYKKIPSP